MFRHTGQRGLLLPPLGLDMCLRWDGRRTCRLFGSRAPLRKRGDGRKALFAVAEQHAHGCEVLVRQMRQHFLVDGILLECLNVLPEPRLPVSRFHVHDDLILYDTITSVTFRVSHRKREFDFCSGSPPDHRQGRLRTAALDHKAEVLAVHRAAAADPYPQLIRRRKPTGSSNP
jgi:hypothetical protein